MTKMVKMTILIILSNFGTGDPEIDTRGAPIDR